MKKLLGLLAVAPMALAACGGEAEVKTPAGSWAYGHSGGIIKAEVEMEDGKVKSVSIDETLDKVANTNEPDFKMITDKDVKIKSNDIFNTKIQYEVITFTEDTCYTDTDGTLAAVVAADSDACTDTWATTGDTLVGNHNYTIAKDGTAPTTKAMVNKYTLPTDFKATQENEETIFSKAATKDEAYEYGHSNWFTAMDAIETLLIGKTQTEVAAIDATAGITGASLGSLEHYIKVAQDAVKNA